MGRLSRTVVIAGVAVACSVGAWLLHRQLKASSQRSRQLAIMDALRSSWASPKDKLQAVADAMLREMEEGLKADGKSRLKMLPSFVEHLPDGTEEGTFYALDLGGTNFRVLRVKLGGRESGIGSTEYEEVAIPPALMRGTTEDLFDFIAKGLAEFVASEGVEFAPPPSHHRELGFTFSFPCHQTALDRGSLIRWTKGFQVAGAEGRDVVEILEAAMRRQHLDMTVRALVNDTVGTLAGARYSEPAAVVGVILGTGTNACYEERVKAIEKMESKGHAEHMVVNMEWGNFWSPPVPANFIDRDLDKESINPGEQGFEKVIGGMYLGELVRRALLHLSQEAAFFTPIPHLLLQPYCLSTPKLSAMDEDTSSDLLLVKDFLKSTLKIEHSTLEQRKVVRELCSIVGERGARLAAAGVYAILKRTGRHEGKKQQTFVAVDGGLYEHYSKFRAHMHAALRELLGEGVSDTVRLDLSKDGSGIGAALLAASHSEYGNKKTGKAES